MHGHMNVKYQQDVSAKPETKTREPIAESIPIYQTEKHS
jgi:hypothetical protein